jgi:hypothetical protein
MIPFKLNGKNLKIASSWLDPTFDQYVKIMENKGGTADMLSIFTGLTVETINKAEIIGLEMVIEALSFLKKPYQFDKATPNVGPYKLPLPSKGEFNIQFETLAQFEDMRAAMIKTPDNDIVELVKSYAKFVAIYVQKIRDGEYNYDKAIAMIPEIYTLPAHEVITTGSFFFVKLLTLLTGTAPTSPKATTSQKKKKQATRSSKKSLAITRRSRK